VRISRYAAVWILAIAAFGGAVWWLITSAPGPRITSSQLSSNPRAQASTPAASIDERLSATNVKIRKSEFTVNSEDGSVKLRVLAAEGSKQRDVYNIRDGALEFSLSKDGAANKQNVVVVHINNATYSSSAGVVHVRGSLVGRIAAGGHTFSADELSWDEGQKKVTTSEVRYVGPNLDVSGKRMSVDLETGTVSFDGPVEVGI